MPKPCGPSARNQAECGEWAFEFDRDAFARPDFVGWSVCGWVDRWRTMADKDFKQHSAFFSAQGELHEPYVACSARGRSASPNSHAGDWLIWDRPPDQYQS